MGLPLTLDINVAQQYSHLRQKLLHMTYDDLRFQLDGNLDVCDGCALLKAKAHTVGNKHTGGRQRREK